MSMKAEVTTPDVLRTSEVGFKIPPKMQDSNMLLEKGGFPKEFVVFPRKDRFEGWGI
jgi:hypothetical protein